MRVFNQHGSKERLFEMIRKVGGSPINEALLSREKKVDVIKKFINFVDKKLKFGKELPEIVLSDDEKEAETMHSFGKFTPSTNTIRVVISNRNLADILRTLGHELVHYRQHLDGRLTSNSNNTGSSDENEANALAGVLLREFGAQNSIIFE